MLENNIYKKSPIVLQNFFMTGRGFLYNFLRQGAIFKGIFSELEKTQYFDKQKIKEWQNKKLRLLVQHVYKNVPYYNRLFRKLRISPGDIRDIEDIKKIPFLTKEDVRTNYNDLLAKNINKIFLAKGFTSGTSGKQLKFYRDLYSVNFENAILWRRRKWGGMDFFDRIVIIKDEPVVPFNVKNPPFWRCSKVERTMFLSAYHISEKSILDYAKAIEDFKPVAIEGMPAELYILSKFIKEQGVSLCAPSIKAIFTSSEVLLPRYKDLIEEVFGAPIYDYYGSTERVSAIQMCQLGSYHVIPEYGITEFLPLDNDSEEMEIVGTGLHNYTMPLLRYRTGDIVRLSNKDCKCGRKFKVVQKIKGRLSDFFMLRDGRIISELSFVLKGLENSIEESQIIQESLDRIRLKFVPVNGFCKKDEKKIKDNVKRYFGTKTELILEKTDRILEDGTVKFRPFVSYVNKGNI